MTLHLGPAEARGVRGESRRCSSSSASRSRGSAGTRSSCGSVPMPHPRFEAERCLRETLAALTGDRFAAVAQRHERLAATVACKAAIKAGDQLSPGGDARAVHRPRRTTLPAHDVHGRSTVVQLSWDELERRFGRRASLRVVCGPTAAGKSALALALARAARRGHHQRRLAPDLPRLRHRHGQADRGGAGTRAALRGRRASIPPTRYSAAAWALDAERWIEQAVAAGRTPLLVGGTGFYLRALFGPLFEEPELDPARRAGLAAVLDPMPLDALRRWCEVLDPDAGASGPHAAAARHRDCAAHRTAA